MMTATPSELHTSGEKNSNAAARRGSTVPLFGRVRSGSVGLDVNDFRRRNLLCGELDLRHQYLPGTITKRPPTSPKFFRKSQMRGTRADEPGHTRRESLEHNGVRFASLAESDTLHLLDCGQCKTFPSSRMTREILTHSRTRSIVTLILPAVPPFACRPYPRWQLTPSFVHPEHAQACLMNVPSFNSANARCSSAWVFITIGPYQAIGSSIGLPETNRNRIPSSPACTVTSSPLSNSTSDRFPVRSRISASLPSLLFPSGPRTAAMRS